MADCSAAGTTIDRAARAVIGGAGVASSTTASKHVGALFGHASMFPVASAAAASMPLASPDHLVMPGGSIGRTLQSQVSAITPSLADAYSIQQQGPSMASQQQHQQQYPSARNLPIQLHQQQFHHHQPSPFEKTKDNEW